MVYAWPKSNKFYENQGKNLSFFCTFWVGFPVTSLFCREYFIVGPVNQFLIVKIKLLTVFDINVPNETCFSVCSFHYWQQINCIDTTMGLISLIDSAHSQALTYQIDSFWKILYIFFNPVKLGLYKVLLFLNVKLDWNDRCYIIFHYMASDVTRYHIT